MMEIPEVVCDIGTLKYLHLNNNPIQRIHANIGGTTSNTGTKKFTY